MSIITVSYSATINKIYTPIKSFHKKDEKGVNFT